MAPRASVSLSGRARVVVGSYESALGAGDGGIRVFDLAADGTLIAIDHVPEPGMGDTLAYAASTHTLYSVDLRRNTGRGSTAPAAAIWAYEVDPATGRLTLCNQRPAPGPNPNYLCLNGDETILVSANHGGFDHVERVRQGEDGGWVVDYTYDDSTVIAFRIRDLHVRRATVATRTVHRRPAAVLRPARTPTVA